MATQTRPAAGALSPSKAGAPHTANTADSQAVTKRLQSELMSLMANTDPGVSAFPDGDSLFSWLGTVQGAAGTPYEGKTYKLSLKFSSEYPFKAPTVKFETACYHPNVDDRTGDICLDVLKENWSAAYSVRTVLLSIQSLLEEPNNDSPLNTDAASLWPNQQRFRELNDKKYAQAAQQQK